MSPGGRAKVKVGPAEELRFDLAGALAGRGAVRHQLLVRVEVNVDMQRDLAVRDANPGRREASVVLARVFSHQTEVLEIVNTLQYKKVTQRKRNNLKTETELYLTWASMSSMGLKSSTGVRRS